jgi:hypothetical protein
LSGGHSFASARLSMLRWRLSPPRIYSVVLSFGLTAGIIATPSLAQADVSAWAYAGGGVSAVNDAKWTPNAPLLQLDVGIGTDPAMPVVGGFVFRSYTHFGNGTDLGLLARLTHAGYVNGAFGVALDVGAFQRWWGDKTGPGGLVSVNVALPWGVSLSTSAGLTKDGEHLAALSLGMDWARFTVHRSVGQNFWPNYSLPLPSAASASTAQ